MVAVVLLVTVSNASAVEAPVKVSVVGEKSIALFFGQISGKVWITFQDTNGTIFYSKRIKDLTSYTAKYNLEAFPDGKYVLELVSADRKLNVPVLIVDGAVTLEEEVAAAPVVSSRGNMVAVELSGDAKKAWDVIIKNTEGDLIFKETVETGENARRKYNLSNLNNGEYTLQFINAGNTFSHNVVVKN